MSWFSWAGNFAVFYLILLAMIGIPLLILFVVLALRAVLDYRVWILGGVVVMMAFAVFLLVRNRRRFLRRYEQEKADVMEVVRAAAREGHNVNISFLHGLVRIDYRGEVGGDGRRLPAPAGGSGAMRPALPFASAGPTADGEEASSRNKESSDLTAELERLSALRDRGAVTEAEFVELKRRLLKSNGL